MSTSQCCEQQSPFIVQASPATLHAWAGTSHRPLTQLSEQQSVFCPHALPNARQVWQLTPGKHANPKQQPLAHDIASQMHAPLAQRWPAAHALLPPQVQAPLVQPSASVPLQAVQAAPPVPQLASDGTSQVLPLQQPLP